MRPLELHSLINNPSWVAILLKHFLFGAQEIKKEGVFLELTLIAIPFLLNENSVAILKSGNKSSSISKFITDERLRSIFIHTKERIEYYKPLVKDGIIFLSNTETIEISHLILIKGKKPTLSTEENIFRRDHFKAAYNLGAALAKEDPIDLLIKFGTN